MRRSKFGSTMLVSNRPQDDRPEGMSPRGPRVARSGAVAFSGRILQLLVLVLTGLLVPICLTPTDVGIIFLVQALLAAGAIIAQMGLTITVPAMITEALARGEYARAWSIAIRALLICVVAGVIVSAVVGILTLAVAYPFGSEIALAIRSVLPFVLLLVPLVAFLAVIVELHRSMGAIEDASILPVIPGLLLGLFMLAALIFSLRLSLADFLLVQLLSVVCTVAAAIARLGRRVNAWRLAGSDNAGVGAILGHSWPNLITTLSLFLISTLDIWIVGVFGGAVDVAQYGLGLRIASLFLIPLATVNATIVPLIVSNWTRGHRRYLQWVLTLTATGATALTAVGYIGFAAIGSPAIDAIWGPTYQPAFTVALMLGVSQVIHTAGGSAGYILLLLGQQRLVMSTTIALGILTVALAVAAMINWGPLGVALTYGSVNIFQTAIFVYLSRRHYGLKTQAAAANPLRLLRTNRPIV